MAYTKQTWADLPSKTTPINAERLTHIEDGIFNAAQTADTAASTAGTAAANVGIVSGKVETLTERVNGLDTAVSNKVDKVTGKGLSTNDYDDTDKGKVDSLGTASTKNSTSVVTQSTDLVESEAVKDIVGWGNKNLLPNNIESDTVNGVTYTAKSDGSVIVNGTATSQSWGHFNLANRVFKKGSYVLSGCPSEGSTGTYFLKLSLSNTVGGTEDLAVIDTGSGATFDVPNDMYIRNYSGIVVQAGQSINNKTFYPMIRDANITDPTYEPYHESVSDSLEDKADNSVIGTVEDGVNPTKAYAVNEFMVRDGAFCQVTAPVTTSSTWTEGSNYTKKSIAEVLQSLMS